MGMRRVCVWGPFHCAQYFPQFAIQVPPNKSTECIHLPLTIAALLWHPIPRATHTSWFLMLSPLVRTSTCNDSRMPHHKTAFPSVIISVFGVYISEKIETRQLAHSDKSVRALTHLHRVNRQMNSSPPAGQNTSQSTTF